MCSVLERKTSFNFKIVEWHLSVSESKTSLPIPIQAQLCDSSLGINSLALLFLEAALELAQGNSTKFVSTYRHEWLSQGRLACLSFPHDASSDGETSVTTWLCAMVFQRAAYFCRCEVDGQHYHYDGSCAINSLELFASKHGRCVTSGLVPMTLREVLGKQQLAAIEYDMEPLRMIEAPARERKQTTLPALQQAACKPNELEVALDVALGITDGDPEASDEDFGLPAQAEQQSQLKRADVALQDEAFTKQYDKLVQ